MMNGTKNIVRKELSRVFHDKKIVLSLFILPAVMIIGLYSLMGTLLNNMLNDIEEHIPNISIQNAPEDFVEFLDATTGFEANISYLGAAEDNSGVKQGILDGTTDLLVVFDDKFLETVAAYQQEGDPIPEVKTYYNTAENYSGSARESFVNRILYTYQQGLVAKRIGNIEQLQVFYIDKNPNESIIINEKKQDGKLLGMLVPFLINIMLFAGAMQLGVDAITGEKERGTLSSMLVSPIKRGEIVFGKLISLAILSSISAAIYAISIVTAMPLLMNGVSEGALSGFGLKLTPLEIIMLLVIMIVTVYLYVAVVAAIAVMARTAKEANTYVMPAYIAVMFGSVMTYAGSGESKLTNFLIPVYNSAVSIQNLLMGELSVAQFGLTVLSILVVAAVITSLVTKAFNSEKIMFNA
jgi:sodium transport system permease protein